MHALDALLDALLDGGEAVVVRKVAFVRVGCSMVSACPCGAPAGADAIIVRFDEVGLENGPRMLVRGESVPFEHRRGIQARSLHGGLGFVDELIERERWFHDD